MSIYTHPTAANTHRISASASEGDQRAGFRFFLCTSDRSPIPHYHHPARVLTVVVDGMMWPHITLSRSPAHRFASQETRLSGDIVHTCCSITSHHAFPLAPKGKDARSATQRKHTPSRVCVCVCVVRCMSAHPTRVCVLFRPVASVECMLSSHRPFTSHAHTSTHTQHHAAQRANKHQRDIPKRGEQAQLVTCRHLIRM